MSGVPSDEISDEKEEGGKCKAERKCEDEIVVKGCVEGGVKRLAKWLPVHRGCYPFKK